MKNKRFPNLSETLRFGHILVHNFLLEHRVLSTEYLELHILRLIYLARYSDNIAN